MSGHFKSCNGYKPPKRYPGCHDHCEEYLAEKAAHDAEKKRMRIVHEKRAFLDGMEKKRAERTRKCKQKDAKRRTRPRRNG